MEDQLLQCALVEWGWVHYEGILRIGSRTVWFYIVAVIVVGLIAGYVVLSEPNSPKFQSEEGILDLTRVDVRTHPQKLTGEWAFYWKELLSPEDIRGRSLMESQDHWINIPSSWSGYRLEGEKLGGTGYATFRLVIKLSEQDRNEHLALRLPSIFNAYKLWVNGELLEEVGNVGKDKSSMTPHLETKLVSFQPENDTVELVMQVANFNHKRGGITMYIELGGSDVLTDRANQQVAAEMFITAGLLVIGVYNLLLFVLATQGQGPVVFWAIHRAGWYSILAKRRAHYYPMVSSIPLGIAVQDRVSDSYR